ncbi:polyprenyl synthetase family protein [Marinobacter sp. R17]|uniref:polyprenyl synthetase family protein n=1 Tax=Marinobacter TaxID=2742 RepID=UPI000F4B9CD1|nr:MULTISPECIES: farnesyl diphosphate synthase [Marinobacter]ROT96233.1 polyprenyl synthetase family protein [Marinobacter sp. R17]
MSSQPMSELQAQWRTVIEATLDRWLDNPDAPAPRLQDAMRYAVLGGGKRIRPILAMASAMAVGHPPDTALVPGCAVELIHAYSLIHDDLPAMDDDALRRGKPTVHIAYDEATAILAGDALQALAFEAIGSEGDYSAPTRVRMLQILSRASGQAGMVGGQAIDLGSVGRTLPLEDLQRMHRCKTGALIEASISLGALAAETADETQIDALRTYGRALGLAFQVQDDLLDIEGATDTIGKPQGSDAARNKPTYPACLGIDGTRDHLRSLQEQAVSALAVLGRSADPLRQIADFVVTRTH